jgi:hypothetical protein
MTDPSKPRKKSYDEIIDASDLSEEQKQAFREINAKVVALENFSLSHELSKIIAVHLPALEQTRRRFRQARNRLEAFKAMLELRAMTDDEIEIITAEQADA